GFPRIPPPTAVAYATTPRGLRSALLDLAILGKTGHHLPREQPEQAEQGEFEEVERALHLETEARRVEEISCGKSGGDRHAHGGNAAVADGDQSGRDEVNEDQVIVLQRRVDHPEETGRQSE